MITLKTLPQATAQEVFDQVANHLLEQGKKSEKDDKCAQFISKLMKLTEEAGFGSDEDVENIETYIG